MNRTRRKALKMLKRRMLKHAIIIPCTFTFWRNRSDYQPAAYSDAKIEPNFIYPNTTND